MKVKELSIKGSYLIKPDVFKDERGLFFENFNNKKISKITKGANFVQGNHSFSKKKRFTRHSLSISKSSVPNVLFNTRSNRCIPS